MQMSFINILAIINDARVYQKLLGMTAIKFHCTIGNTCTAFNTHFTSQEAIELNAILLQLARTMHHHDIVLPLIVQFYF